MKQNLCGTKLTLQNHIVTALHVHGNGTICHVNTCLKYFAHVDGVSWGEPCLFVQKVIFLFFFFVADTF